MYLHIYTVYMAGQKIVKAFKCEWFGNGISERFSNLSRVKTDYYSLG